MHVKNTIRFMIFLLLSFNHLTPIVPMGLRCFWSALLLAHRFEQYNRNRSRQV
jgi:hypothetical protein